MTTTLTREVWVVRRGAGTSTPRPPEWCRGCAGPSGMLTPDEAAAAAGVTTRTVYHWVEAGRVHFKEGAGGALHVCLASLPRAAG